MTTSFSWSVRPCRLFTDPQPAVSTVAPVVGEETSPERWYSMGFTASVTVMGRSSWKSRGKMERMSSQHHLPPVGPGNHNKHHHQNTKAVDCGHHPLVAHKEATTLMLPGLTFLQLDGGHSSITRSIHRLQRVQNAAAGLLTHTKSWHQVLPVLRDLHWLPVTCRINYKILPSRSLPVPPGPPLLAFSPPPPKSNLRSFGDRAFSRAAPRLWDSLPQDIRDSESLAVFPSRLKTHLPRGANYRRAYLARCSPRPAPPPPPPPPPRNPHTEAEQESMEVEGWGASAQEQAEVSGAAVPPDGCRHKGAPETPRLAPGGGGGVSLWLKVPPTSATAYHGGDGEGLMLSLVLLSTTASRLPSSSPTTELTFLTSLLSLLVSPALMPPSQHVRAKNCAGHQILI
ncbi:hypothetical protein N1851_003492 [Merluccius polli]|uniref:Uncharacterized protein n=1 Tax=Merluccius polli TaxID=89951 RepID=A0AA47PAF2_MERPO|nr:hypothetical protein N1851_003492 [Merluccius polli]